MGGAKQAVETGEERAPNDHLHWGIPPQVVDVVVLTCRGHRSVHGHGWFLSLIHAEGGTGLSGGTDIENTEPTTQTKLVLRHRAQHRAESGKITMCGAFSHTHTVYTHAAAHASCGLQNFLSAFRPC